MSAPAFSLVIATRGRTAEPARLLASLREQTQRDFEVVLVDQNPDDRLEGVVREAAAGLSLRHLRRDPGVSAARNAGLREARGKVVTFPDDDCWYPPDLLERVGSFLASQPAYAGISGSYADADGRTWRGLHDARGEITRYNVWRRSVGFSFFLRAEAARAVSFDETLGPGAGTPWESGEDTDYVLRVLEAGFRLYYDSRLRVFHPYPLRPGSPGWLEKAHGYARGTGRVLRKHYPVWFAAYYWGRALGGAIVHGVSGGPEATYHRRVLAGRIRGWLDPLPRSRARP